MAQSQQIIDERFMRRALALAEKGRGYTQTNPLVGAVLVKNSRIVAQGYHARFGKDHAERMALLSAGKKAKGATLYVTLEPCSTFGKTPPCTDMIIASGVVRVVIAQIDPNPLHKNKGVRILKRHGISVTTGTCREDACRQNRFFETLIKEKRPYVILKEAHSLDGKIATRTGNSKWITSSASRKLVHRMRHEVDAIMVGSQTVRRDDPSLTVRHGTPRKNPIRIIMNSRGDLPLTKKVFQRSQKEQVITVIASAVPVAKKKKYMKKGITVISVPRLKSGLDLTALLKELRYLNIGTVLVEGGGTLAASLLEKRLVDECHFFVAPKLIGGRSATTSVEGHGVATVAGAVLLKELVMTPVADDYLFSGFPDYGI